MREFGAPNLTDKEWLYGGTRELDVIALDPELERMVTQALTSPHGAIKAQVYVFHGIREDTIGMPLGLGHTEYGRYAKDRGVNALDLLGATDGQGYLPYVATRVSVTKTAGYRKVAKTEGNPRQLGRGIIEQMPLVYAAQGMTPEQAYKAAGGETHEINPPREREAIDGWYEAQKEGWTIVF